MKKIVINGHVVEYNTVAELADIMSVMGVGTQAPAKNKKPTGNKARKPSAAELDAHIKASKNAKPKPTTRKEALAQWEADKGITPESKAIYKQLINSNSEFYKEHWNARVNDKTYQAKLAKYGKQFANKEWHKYICELAGNEALIRAKK